MQKIIYCGTPSISLKPLKALEDMGFKICAIITQPDNNFGRQKNSNISPIKQYAIENGYSYYQPNKIIDIKNELESIEADYLITCAYGQFIPDSVLNLFKNCINVHASLLPKYRGGSPVQFALMNGDKETGISLMQMVKKMDAGDVYVQKSIPIDINDDNGSLFDKLGNLAYEIVKENIIEIFNNNIEPVKQDENHVTFALNLKNDEEKINWDQEDEKIHNFVRALSPNPIAFTYLDNERIKIKKTSLMDENDFVIIPLKMFFPGEIAVIDKKGIVVATKTKFIRILEIQRQGKKMLPASTYYNQKNGFIKPGMIFK
ncbi:methionyl-tRNA formyltransferase [Spiroplasma litorale]|uniref:Methionyl-tRNA formyltransferase n=1 Tax=Spiroplasma litorale TaxID=216942 RepID=A0A0K1W2I3_9MOLU|nr:methionyl-tRNA formyltransferase [Spiroplasma litorale]AKX34386.1 methionyl-tRNA formyltransferase [Spiroplasma litorale]